MAIEPTQHQLREKKPSTTARPTAGRHASPRIAASPAPYKSPTLSKESQWDNGRTPQRSRIEEIVTPVTTILSSNITPRSSSRKARVDSASSTPIETPAGTPTRSRPTSTVSASVSNGTKDASTLPKGPGPRGGQVARSSARSLTNGSKSPPSRAPLPENGREAAELETQPKFFHANEAKENCFSKPSLQRFNAQQYKAPCFVYANGEVDEGTPSSSSTTSPLTSETPLSKFFHANSIPESRPCIDVDSKTEAYSSLIKTFSPLDTSRPSSKQGAFSPVPLHRPPSPLKEVSIANKDSKQSSPRSSVVSSNRPLRRSSVKCPTQTPSPHSRSNSVASIDASLNSRITSKNILNSTLDASISGTLVAEPISFVQDIQTAPVLPIASSQSPIKPTFDTSHDLAASARRERKVLDLEISNSSLLAINRTLEREMRKQNNELRRYRRLTQAGRLSQARSSNSISAQRRSMLPSEDGEFSDGEDRLEFDVSEYGDNEDEEDEQTLSIPDEPHSPSTRQRAKDAKRLQLDLSKHHELIVDSQKLNQSIKRCLCWTDTLIEEGKRALAYQVRLSEVGATGGRVLRREEVGSDTEEPGRGSALLSPGPDGVEEFIGDESTMALDADDMIIDDGDGSNDSRESVFSMISSPQWKRESYGDDAGAVGMAI